MRIAALMPTRDRPVIAARAVSSFLDALSQTGLATTLTLVIADDHSRSGASTQLRGLMQQIRERHVSARIEFAEPDRTCTSAPCAEGVSNGPGRARNRALAKLSKLAVHAEITIMFDDDVSFADTSYLGELLRCDGPALVAEAISAACEARTVAGCDYLGRQDLSIIEHVRLARGTRHYPGGFAPAVDREGVESLAPGGISTAFLAIGANPSALPDFPEHYNEDYVWLSALARAGWPLRKLSRSLIHAPPGDVEVNRSSLSHEVFGEVVWSAILGQGYAGVVAAHSLAVAIDEIVHDLDLALENPNVAMQPETVDVIEGVRRDYQTIRLELLSSHAGPVAKRLLAAVRAGLNLAPA